MGLIASIYSSEKMSFAVGMLSTSATVGPTLAFILSGYLASIYDWRKSFLIPSLILTLSSIYFWFSLKDNRIKSIRQNESNVLVVFKKQGNMVSWFDLFLFLFDYKGILNMDPNLHI